MIVRRERPAGHDRVRAVHTAAFRPRDGGDAVEARLVDELPHLHARLLRGGPVQGVFRYAEPSTGC